MTTTETQETSVTETTETDTQAPQAPVPENAPDEIRPSNREARYRVERNEARAERDELAARLVSLQTAQLHKLAGELLSQPEDIGLSRRELSDFLTPGGWLDAEAVAEAAAQVIESRPGLAKNPKVPATDPSQGMGGVSGKGQPRWADLFKD